MLAFLSDPWLVGKRAPTKVDTAATVHVEAYGCVVCPLVYIHVLVLLQDTVLVKLYVATVSYFQCLLLFLVVLACDDVLARVCAAVPALGG